MQNLNQKSPGYTEYVFLCVPAYDDRGPPTDFYIEGDPATKMLIYTPPYSTFASTLLSTGQKVHLQADMLPFALDSIQKGYEKGCLSSSNPDDYQIGGMNIGFELTGRNTTTIAFQNLSLRAVHK